MRIGHFQETKRTTDEVVKLENLTNQYVPSFFFVSKSF